MIPNSKEVNECHNIDIIELRDYVDKYVRVSIKGGKVFEGVMYTVDPVSGCVVLVNRPTNSFDLIFGHAVDKIVVLKDTGEKLTLFDNPQASQKIDSPKKDAMMKLKNWLLQNRIPVVEVGTELKLGDMLTIVPPYNSDCCLSTNEIVLDNVQRLIQSMPTE
uniref:Gem-associated protein 6 n=1 Tax=Lygus hesperus TaxID=30085 RepID=A0A0A9ZIJ6_LYGHE